MIKCKVFVAMDEVDLEDNISTWLHDTQTNSDVEIISSTMTEDDDSIYTLVIFYRKKLK